jgi:hypothetical protein
VVEGEAAAAEAADERRDGELILEVLGCAPPTPARADCGGSAPDETTDHSPRRLAHKILAPLDKEKDHVQIQECC